MTHRLIIQPKVVTRRNDQAIKYSEEKANQIVEDLTNAKIEIDRLIRTIVKGKQIRPATITSKEEQTNMHNTKVTMKNGTIYQAPIHTWRPREGWFQLFKVDSTIPNKIQLDDVEQMVTKNQRCRPGLESIGDEDDLQRAINQGWTPKGETHVAAIIWVDTNTKAPNNVKTYSTLAEAEIHIPENVTIYRYNVPHMGVYFFAGTEANNQ